MISENRKQQILDLIRKNGSVRVANLSQLFEVSEVTIRNYLADMESKGLLTRTHGGAISSYKPYCSMNFNQRLETNHFEKDILWNKNDSPKTTTALYVRTAARRSCPSATPQETTVPSAFALCTWT